LELNSNRL